MSAIEETLGRLRVGSAGMVSEAELASKLREARPLRIKFGVDPTSSDLHLGHAVILSKLRQFQDFGHLAILVIGDFTTMVGDPSGRSHLRPMLSRDQVLANAETYTAQAFKILDRDRTEVVFNGTWFSRMDFMDVIRLNSRVTLQQTLQREDFKKRIDAGAAIYLHELQYPVMQGWDSVMIRADVELGGTDQLFNLLVGRDLQKAEAQAPQVVCVMPILEGLDGVQKMSKSLGNYVGIAEPAAEMFGKLMSISDELMARYYEALLHEPLPALHPLEAKKKLAGRIVERFYDGAAAQSARDGFERRFAKRDLQGADLPTVPFAKLPGDVTGAVVAAYAEAFGMAKSRGDARRLIEGGSVQWRGEKVNDPHAGLDLHAGGVLKLDKTRAVRIEGGGGEEGS